MLSVIHPYTFLNKIPEPVCIYACADPDIGGLLCDPQLITDGTSIAGPLIDIHHHIHVLGGDAAGIYEIAYAGGIMHRTSRQTIGLGLGLEGEVHDVSKELSGFIAHGFHTVYHILSAGGLIGKIQAHHDWDIWKEMPLPEARSSG